MVLYITSLTENAGKTMVSAGLGKYWLDHGKKVGYLKLNNIKEGQAAPAVAEKDALFIKKIFNLAEPVETISTIIGKNAESLKPALEIMSKDKDIVIVEGLPLNTSSEAIETLADKVLVVHDYATPLSTILATCQKLSGRLSGIVLNKVPRSKTAAWRDQVNREASSSGIRILGIIPEDRILATLSINDLAEALQGKILNNAEKAQDLIENLMMGSSTFDRGAAYYNRKANKAVFLWGERPGYRKPVIANLQTAALQTSVRCLVISANGEPIPAVSQKAAEKQVPIISAPGTLPSLIAALEKAMGNLKFGQEQKLPRLEETLRQNLDMIQISKELSLAN